MSEELNRELKQIKRDLSKAREDYNTSVVSGIPNKKIYYKVIELEAQYQMVVKLMKKYYFVK